MKLQFFFPLFLLIVSPSFAQQVYIDESLSDWDQIDPLYTDGEDSFSPVNFGVLKIDNDDRFLYFYLEVGAEITLQENNNVTLFIDTDYNTSTGNTKDEIGADLEYNLGQRRGSIHRNSSTNINSYNIGLVSAPTVTSTWFEFKIDLNTTINGTPLFKGNKIAVVITSASGDQIPEKNQELTYTLKSDKVFEPTSYQIKKPLYSDLRVLTYNVLRDNLFDPSKQEYFQRIISAIDPDIIGFQEIYDNSGEQAAALVETFLPSEAGEQWYHGDTGNDNLIVSRYPITKQQTVDGNAAYLLDLGTRDLLALVAHPPCCANGDTGRQREINAMMAFVRKSKSGEAFDIADKTPIIIMGDMNMVGQAQQQRTLLTGDITNNTNHGPDFDPDWDGSAFEDAKPFNPEMPTTFTWYSSGSSFSAGRLDYMVYSGSVLHLDNTFSLFTPALPADTLSQYGIQSDDSIIASDHLPVVADFTFTELSSNQFMDEIPTSVGLMQNYPNPFNPGTTLTFRLDTPSRISLSVQTITGQTVAVLVDNQMLSSGIHSRYFDATDLASGVYLYQLQSGEQVITKKMLLIK
ncbi:MAG: endonuclease/exonuclease/phosphatase family protein [Balneolaceae bacterium]|nr:endonuclease/exonuclease/phosphatase family protein [Balneolaceae bacterium]